jgi:hypothetical protein
MTAIKLQIPKDVFYSGKATDQILILNINSPDDEIIVLRQAYAAWWSALAAGAAYEMALKSTVEKFGEKIIAEIECLASFLVDRHYLELSAGTLSEQVSTEMLNQNYFEVRGLPEQDIHDATKAIPVFATNLYSAGAGGSCDNFNFTDNGTGNPMEHCIV